MTLAFNIILLSISKLLQTNDQIFKSIIICFIKQSP